MATCCVIVLPPWTTVPERRLAMIAGLARAPSRYSPVTSPERALARRRVVLHDMFEVGYITAEQLEAASTEPLRLVTPTDVFRLRAPYYAEHVRRAVGDKLGEASVLQDGLQIETPAQLLSLIHI